MTELKQKQQTLQTLKHALAVNDLIPTENLIRPAKILFVTASIRSAAMKEFCAELIRGFLEFTNLAPMMYEDPYGTYYLVRIDTPSMRFIEALVDDERCFEFSVDINDEMVRL